MGEQFWKIGGILQNHVYQSCLQTQDAESSIKWSYANVLRP